MVLQKLNGKDSWVTMDIFKGDSQSKLIEHWDIIESYSSSNQINGKFNFEKNTYNLREITSKGVSNFNNFIKDAKNY